MIEVLKLKGESYKFQRVLALGGDSKSKMNVKIRERLAKKIRKLIIDTKYLKTKNQVVD